jgi:hypothetical protein
MTRRRLPRQFGADRGHQVMLDIADRHPARIQADDHVVEAAQAPGPFRDQPRGERPVPIPRHGEIDLPDLGLDRFRGVTIPGVHVLGCLWRALLITEVIGQLRGQPTLESGLDQPRDQTVAAGHRDLAGIDPSEQRVQGPRRRQLVDHVLASR